jgi:ABC-2 type transport system ATP-binding protein
MSAGLPQARVEEVLDLVELTDAADRRVGTYSLGMRQRLGLATALLGDPDVLVADEPANGLDPEGIAWLRRFLRATADEGRTVIISSHLLAEVARTADRIVVVSEGRLRFDGDLTELAGPAGPGDADALEEAFLRLTIGVAA